MSRSAKWKIYRIATRALLLENIIEVYDQHEIIDLLAPFLGIYLEDSPSSAEGQSLTTLLSGLRSIAVVL
jgi:hypothetical protein